MLLETNSRASVEGIPRSTSGFVETLLAYKDVNNTNEAIDHIMDLIEEYGGMAAINDSPEIQLQLLRAVVAHCQARYQLQNNERLLDLCIACERQATELSERLHLPTTEQFRSLGCLLYDRFKISRNALDINEAIESETRAVALSSEDDVLHGACLSTLAFLLQTRFDWLGVIADSNNSIECSEKAIEVTPENHPDRFDRLSNLGISWARRFERLGELADIDRAIECLSRAVELTPDRHPKKPTYLSNLGISWRSRFKRLGELVDVDHAIECLSQAVELTPDGHSDKPGHLGILGGLWIIRFERLGELANVDHAIECLSRAVELTPEGHPNKPTYLSNLGILWKSRFERLGELADADRAIECLFRSVELTPEGHSNKPGRLSILGNSWRSRFERTGELADIDHAIECHSQAIGLTPQGYPEKPSRLNSLGNSWLCRFERIGELADIDNAIEYLSRAVELTPEGHPGKPDYLNNLGTSWLYRFERIGELTDADHAIECLSRTVEFTPDGHPNKLNYLANLGTSWLRRFERLGELADLDHAIECQSHAVKLIPDGHPDQPTHLSNLGGSLFRRFERLGELVDVDHAIECLSRAVELTPDDNPDKPGCLSNLGVSWRLLFTRMRRPVDLEKACDAFMTSAKGTAFQPKIQMECARRWAEALTLLQRSPLEAYQVAFSLLPRLIWIGQPIHHRYQTVTSVGNLAAEAAAWAVSVHLYDLALEWLEQGRSVVWGQTMQLRTSFEELASADYELAQTLQNVASQLDEAGSNHILQLQRLLLINLASRAAHHHQMALKWEELLKKARLLPGFENFMRPLKSKEIKAAAKDGPVVVINTYRAQCDGLIILPGSNSIIHVPLTKVSEEKLEQLKTKLHCMMGQRGDPNYVRGFTRDKPKGSSQIPVLIWSDIVEPVLKALGYSDGSKLDELPHVTWCTTGAMSFLPLHAAGLYDGLSPNASDLVVSSYTPTLTALLLHRTPSTNQTGLVTIGQEESPGQAGLPNTVDELKVISKHNTVTFHRRLDSASATVSATLAAIRENSWVHLACHAVQNTSDPGQSGFHLYDGKLTLGEIVRWKFKNKGLAFLSACQTATGHDGFPDEATHLAAGMLMAGYPSVIGTMWSIMDEDAPLVADVVYSELLKDGNMDHTRSSRALHKAVKTLQEKVGVDKIWRWAPFIHIGA
ncbi:CHAT domain protein [Ceratobasidium sp. AG-Ba]|nr:CHAT domain protein [Ceratobasidium sp. AG-Ba]QRW10822.1 CHAT domain protein [Ceratobasidium sp. AG-Ba]